MAPKPTSKNPKAKIDVVDSWEDEMDALSDTEDVKQDSAPDTPDVDTPAPPSPPPPTPSSPLHTGHAFDVPGWNDPHPAQPSRSGPGPNKRPEKTDAVARRMIAGALGLKAPKLTEEQKAYNKSIREQEKKRREQERAEEQRQRQEAEKAKAAIWND